MWILTERRQVTRSSSSQMEVGDNEWLNDWMIDRLWRWLPNWRNRKTGSHRGFLRREAKHVGEGRASGPAHAKQWCVRGTDFSSRQVSMHFILFYFYLFFALTSQFLRTLDLSVNMTPVRHFMEFCAVVRRVVQMGKFMEWNQMKGRTIFVVDFSFRFLEHFILNGPDPKALDTVLGQLDDPNRKQPKDLDGAVMGTRAVSLRHRVRLPDSFEQISLRRWNNMKFDSRVLIFHCSHSRAYSSGEGRVIQNSPWGHSGCLPQHLRYQFSFQVAKLKKNLKIDSKDRAIL